jgi:hypothetical protein
MRYFIHKEERHLRVLEEERRVYGISFREVELWISYVE